MPDERQLRRHDELVMAAALSLLAYAVANVVHEGLGHGAVCVLLGGKAKVLSSMHFDGSTEGLPAWCGRLVAAGGTLANGLAAALAFAALRRLREPAVHLRYLLWVFGTINLLQAAGYFLFSGVGGIGDWMGVIYGLPAQPAWRVGMALFGVAAYGYAVVFSVARLAPFFGEEQPQRIGRTRFLMWVPYVTGALLYLGAGALNPDRSALLLISAAASSLGGTSGLAWGFQFLHGPAFAQAKGPALRLPLHPGWVATSLLLSAAFVVVLGRGIVFAAGK